MTPDRPRRVVLAVDADARPTGELSVVVLLAPLRLEDVASIQIDAPAAAAAVLEAAAAPDDQGLLDKALDHDLGWYGVQEISDLLTLTSGGDHQT